MDRAVIFERTGDLDMVRGILVDPAIYPYIGDDFSPPREDFQPNDDERIWYVIGREWQPPCHGKCGDWECERAQEGIGLFMFVPESPICWQVHVAMRRDIKPVVTHEAGREIAAWIWKHTECRRLIASVPVSNRAAVRFGLKAMGLRAYGRNRASFLKHGKLWDQVLMGISRA